MEDDTLNLSPVSVKRVGNIFIPSIPNTELTSWVDRATGMWGPLLI
jgi:hypothetical protein